MHTLGERTTLGTLGYGEFFFRADEVDNQANGHRPGQIPTRCQKIMVGDGIKVNESPALGFLPDYVVVWNNDLSVYRIKDS